MNQFLTGDKVIVSTPWGPVKATVQGRTIYSDSRLPKIFLTVRKEDKPNYLRLRSCGDKFALDAYEIDVEKI